MSKRREYYKRVALKLIGCYPSYVYERQYFNVLSLQAAALWTFFEAREHYMPYGDKMRDG